MKTLRDFEFKNKRVLVRCDFNVPLDEKGLISDDLKIKETIPTIEYLIKKEARIVLMSHLDDPEGKVVEKLKFDRVQEKLTEYLDFSVTKAADCVGKEVEEWTREMRPGEILLLENLRFHKEEKENEENFAKRLSNLGDVYVNDAFGSSHRAHASIVGVPKYLPSGAGFLLEKEVKVLTDLMEDSKKPLVAIIGGAKVETKTKLIDKISEIADFVLIGGLIKREIGEKKITLKYPQKIVAPVDEIEEKDIGPKTTNLFQEKIEKAKTVFWNGPLGETEKKEFRKGSEEIAKAVIESGAISVVGGGETLEFLNELKLTEKFNHVSTGGGAMLDFISDGELIGIKALEK